jgi:HAD superfamily hydrolase (TIGR01484 family)
METRLTWQSTKHVVCSDLDRTLIENDAAPPTNSVPVLSELLRQNNLPIWFVTGEHIDEVTSNIQRHGLPDPAVVVSENGTTVHIRKDGKLVEDHEHKERIRLASPGWDVWKFRDIFREDPLLRETVWLQEDHRQNEFKLSFYVHPSNLYRAADRAEELVTKICPSAYIIRCIHNDDPERAFLDVMSHKGDKAGGLAQVADHFGLGPDSLAMAGDAGNDLLVLANQRFLGTVVNNARNEFKRQVQARAEKLGVEGRVHFARGIEELGLTGNYSEGTMEGLMHHGIVTREQLESAIRSVRKLELPTR